MKKPVIMRELQIAFAGFNCRLMIGQYQNNGRIAFQLYDAQDGTPVATATVNQVYKPDPEKYHVDIKNYSENEGMFAALTVAGIINHEHRFNGVGVAVRAEVVHPEVRKIMDEFYAEN